MTTITINEYSEIEDLMLLLKGVHETNYPVSMYLLNTIGAKKACTRLKFQGFEADEIPCSLLGYEVLFRDLTWNTVIHDFISQRSANKHLLVFADNPSTVYEYDADLTGHEKIYDIRLKPLTSAESIANIGKEMATPKPDDWIIEPVPPTNRKRAK